MTVTGVRTFKELLGEPCIDLELTPPDKKQICTSRSFGSAITDFFSISEAVSTFAVSCARKLRKQNSLAVSIMVFLHTNYFRTDQAQYSKSIIVTLPVPSSTDIDIAHYANVGLQKIYAEGFQYKKAGVIIIEIVSSKSFQLNIFENTDHARQDKLMEAIDNINNKYTNSIRLASQGGGEGRRGDWQLKQNYISRSFTTKINDIITIKCTK